MLKLSSTQADFQQQLQALLAFETAQDPAVDSAVAAICDDVKARGDAAVLEYTNRFDRMQATSMADLTLSREQLEAAWQRLPAECNRH
jgi:histidinol dehydrogenase